MMVISVCFVLRLTLHDGNKKILYVLIPYTVELTTRYELDGPRLDSQWRRDRPD